MARQARNAGFALFATVVALSLLVSLTPARAAVTADATLDELVGADWAGQERRKDRSPDDPEAVRAAYHKAQALLRNKGRRHCSGIRPVSLRKACPRR